MEVWNLWGRYGLVLVAAFGAQRAWFGPEEVPAAAPATDRVPALRARLKPVLHRPAAVPQELELNPVT